MPNRLAHESSPYLQQHQNNPVDWYPWGNDALERARRENKPILLSIGYSACHWCHVMEHESFENPQIAKLMNENFINIKVDREERPDLDQIYQNVAQALTRSGGWPLTVFLTPDRKPFYGGTYFPPEDRYGRPGFPRVLAALAEAFKNESQAIAEQAEKLTQFIGELEEGSAGASGEAGRIGMSELKDLAGDLLGQVDWENGGFGGAPKFPNPMVFSFLWRIGEAVQSKPARDAVLLALRKMATGGIYDQLGGGFHRYSVDSTWSVPHFEKMLYDNALLLRLYSEALLQRKDELFTRVVDETVGYVLREMTSDEGAFYSTQDADSEGEEGKSFVWDPEDLARELSPEEARVAAEHFGVTPEGNFEHGKTVLFVARPLEELSAEDKVLLTSAKAKLLAARQKRVAPGRDDKILAGWNGLMISGLCWAWAATGNPAALEAARKAYRFIVEKMRTDQGRLYSVFKDGRARLNGYLDDYAFMSMAALDLARFTDRETEVAPYLEDSRKWLRVILERFKQPGRAGYYFTSDDHEQLIQRPKTVHDQAIPSGTAVALAAMAAFEPEFESELTEQLPLLSPVARKNPYACGELLCTFLLFDQGPVTVSGPHAELACRHPAVFRKPAEGERYLVCHRQTCGAPLASAEEASRQAAEKLGMGIA